jgi:rhodanese-related sulfurtransferase
MRIPIAASLEPAAGAAHSRSYRHEELRSRLTDPTLVIADVLPRVAYEGARIPGSLCLPLDEIPQRARTLLPDFDQEIALYCGGPT